MQCGVLFFFQAEDGIRDIGVTGVQTCALPILRGYKEEGTTTTPFDMVMLNDLDRYHLVIDVIDRVPHLGSKAAGLRQRMVDQRIHAREYTRTDRKSTRLNSSHANISYAVFCLKKKKSKQQ